MTRWSLLECVILRAMKRAISSYFIVFLLAGFSAISASAYKQIEPGPYCRNMQLIDHSTLSAVNSSTAPMKADRIVVSKAHKKLYLLSQGRLMKEYSVAFGFGFKDGAKERSGDGRTPEGVYRINLKKKVTAYYLALQISYPNEFDRQYAAQHGFNPGGDILIHGFPTRPVDGLTPKLVESIHTERDWTQGCMGLTNAEITELFNLVDAQIPIEICSLNQ